MKTLHDRRQEVVVNVCQRIRFPASADTLPLYFALTGPSVVEFPTRRIVLRAGGKLSGNAYFNCIYERQLRASTNISDTSFILSASGKCEIRLYRETLESPPECLSILRHDSNESGKEVRISVPDAPEGREGRVYFDLRCSEGECRFEGGALVTNAPRLNEVRLAVVTVTHHREMSIRRTVDALLEDEDLSPRIRIYVVDNGRTLSQSDFKPGHVTLLPNANTGGSGGFARGLEEALSDPEITHVLFMDDDIVLETESVFRTIARFEHATSALIVSGSMLDVDDPVLLHEAGTRISGALGMKTRRLFLLHPLYSRIRLDAPMALNKLLEGQLEPEYGAFWFFAMPRALPRAIGSILPFFVHGDDIEFSRRAFVYARCPVFVPHGVAIWHHTWNPRTFTQMPVYRYYGRRNSLITHSLYANFSLLETLRDLHFDFMDQLRTYDYALMVALIQSTLDWMRGPAIMFEKLSDERHQETLAFFHGYPFRQIVFNPSNRAGLPDMRREPFVSRLLFYMTLCNHLLPRFCFNGRAPLRLYELQRRAAAGRSEVWIWKQGRGYYRNSISRRVGLRLCARWIFILLRVVLDWRAINERWKSAFDELRGFPAAAKMRAADEVQR